MFCISPALVASAASKVPKPGFGFDWNTGGPLYKPWNFHGLCDYDSKDVFDLTWLQSIRHVPGNWYKNTEKYAWSNSQMLSVFNIAWASRERIIGLASSSSRFSSSICSRRESLVINGARVLQNLDVLPVTQPNVKAVKETPNTDPNTHCSRPW